MYGSVSGPGTAPDDSLRKRGIARRLKGCGRMDFNALEAAGIYGRSSVR